MKYKSRPITSKACASPLKSDANLILGAGDASKKFVDVAGAMKKGLDTIDNRRTNYTSFDKTGNSEKGDNNKGQSSNAIDPENNKTNE